MAVSKLFSWGFKQQSTDEKTTTTNYLSGLFWTLAIQLAELINSIEFVDVFFAGKVSQKG
jgi:hypothetical protein